MNQHLNANDLTTVVENDKAHIWHHLSQHAPYEKIDPRIIVEGKGMRVWDQHGKEHIDAVSGGVWTVNVCLLYTSPSPRDQRGSRMPSSA